MALGFSAVGLAMTVGRAKRVATTSSQVGLWGQSCRKVAMQVSRLRAPNAFLKSRLTTWDHPGFGEVRFAQKLTSDRSASFI